MPIRKIPIQSRSVAGRFFSHKNNELLDFESQLEKKYFLLLEFDDKVISYEPQPLKIERYIPDVLVYRQNNISLLVEVKYSEEAFNPDEKLQRKFDTLTNYCSENNLEFKIFTEQEIIEPYFSNINLIYNYANLNVLDEIKDKIKELIPPNGISIADLMVKVNNDIQYLSFIYNLIFKKELKVNLHRKISYDTIIRVNND